MIPKLPTISGREAIKRFEQLGYVVIRQKGSHIRLHHASDASRKPLTVPDHKTLGKGLLRTLMRDAKVTLEDFLAL